MCCQPNPEVALSLSLSFAQTKRSSSLDIVHSIRHFEEERQAGARGDERKVRKKARAGSQTVACDTDLVRPASTLGLSARSPHSFCVELFFFFNFCCGCACNGLSLRFCLFHWSSHHVAQSSAWLTITSSIHKECSSCPSSCSHHEASECFFSCLFCFVADGLLLCSFFFVFNFGVYFSSFWRIFCRLVFGFLSRCQTALRGRGYLFSCSILGHRSGLPTMQTGFRCCEPCHQDSSGSTDTGRGTPARRHAHGEARSSSSSGRRWE